MRLLEKENAIARALREKREKEEAERNAYKEAVFTEHEKTTNYSTQSSFKAGTVRDKIKKTIRTRQPTIFQFCKAISSR